MKLSDCITEFEYDWLITPAKKQLKLIQQLTSGNILVLGENPHGLSEHILKELAFLNESFQKEFVLYVKSKEKSPCWLDHRNDVSFFSDFEEIKQVEIDIVIYCGYCNEELDFVYSSYSAYYRNVSNTIEALRTLKIKRLIIYSDYRIYGEMTKNQVMSEYEFCQEDLMQPENWACMLMRSIENLCISLSFKQGIAYTIFRPAMIYGADITFGNKMYQFKEEIAEYKNISICESGVLYSFIYITDLLSAMLFELAHSSQNKIYNLTGEKGTVTLGALADILYLNFSDEITVSQTYLEKNKQSGYALDDIRFRQRGWAPQIDLEMGCMLFFSSILNKKTVFQFQTTYNGKLDRIHQVLLGLMLEIDRICKKHKIQYFLAGGTLLGAVRHHGFIPWDDDADIMMTREHYNKFLSVAEEELPPYLFLQLPKTESCNHNLFSKIRINNTLLATEFTARFPDMHNGIFLDIVAHDATSDRRLPRKIHIQMTRIIRSLVFRKWAAEDFAKEEYSFFLRNMFSLIKNILPMKFLEWLQEKIVRFYEKKDTAVLYDGMGRNIGRGEFPKEWLEETAYISFEGIPMPIPKEFDQYLNYLYGDYMQMIPMSERRVSHPMVYIDLGEYINYTLTKNDRRSISEQR